jgi:hypothetical protein
LSPITSTIPVGAERPKMETTHLIDTLPPGTLIEPIEGERCGFAATLPDGEVRYYSVMHGPDGLPTVIKTVWPKGVGVTVEIGKAGEQPA